MSDQDQIPHYYYWRYQFPIFRGVTVLLIYQFLLSINIFIYERSKINFKTIWKLNKSDQQTISSEQMWSQLIIYGLIQILWISIDIMYDYQKEESFYDQTPRENLENYVGLIVFLTFLLYVFFPFRCTRRQPQPFQSLKVIYKISTSPCKPMYSFLSWATNQLISIAKPINDLVYTSCYYVMLFTTNEAENQLIFSCRDYTKEYYFVIILIPLSYRCMQNIREGIDKKALWMKPNMFNAIKYFFMILTNISSYMYGTKIVNWAVFFWILFATISCFYSYTWDLLQDWGLCQKRSKNKFLRDELLYPKPVYYFAICFNIVLRFVWISVLTNPMIFENYGILVDNYYTLLIEVLEVIRRWQWNCFKMEYEQVKLNQKKKEKIKKEISVIRKTPIDNLTQSIRIQLSAKKQILKKSLLNKFKCDGALELSYANSISNDESNTTGITNLIMNKELFDQTVSDISSFHDSQLQSVLGKSNSKISEKYSQNPQKHQKYSQVLSISLLKSRTELQKSSSDSSAHPSGDIVMKHNYIEIPGSTIQEARETFVEQQENEEKVEEDLKEQLLKFQKAQNQQNQLY